MVPLTDKVKKDESQCWYADDTSSGGKLRDLRSWWDKVVCPEYEYLPNWGRHGWWSRVTHRRGSQHLWQLRRPDY